MLIGATTIGPFEISHYPPQPGWFDHGQACEEHEAAAGYRFHLDQQRNQVPSFFRMFNVYSNLDLPGPPMKTRQIFEMNFLGIA
jgi:hypothetical protein